MKDSSQTHHLVGSCLFLGAALAMALIAVNMSFAGWNQSVAQGTLAIVLDVAENPESASQVETLDEARTTARSTATVLATSNCFTATLDGQGAVEVDLSGSHGISEQDALALAQAAAQRQEESGVIGGYAYLRRDGLLAMLDVSEQAMQQISLCVSSLGWGAVALAAMIGYVAFVTVRTLRPLRQKTSGGSKLLLAYAEQVHEVADQYPDIPALQGISGGLAAGSMALGTIAKTTSLNLTDFVQAAVRRMEGHVGEKGGRVAASLEQGVHVRAKADLLEALCMLLLSCAVTQMRVGATVHVDVLSDGTQAALMVQYSLPEENAEPASDLVTAARVLALGMGASASFEMPRPGTACYAIKLRVAVSRM